MISPEITVDQFYFVNGVNNRYTPFTCQKLTVKNCLKFKEFNQCEKCDKGYYLD